MKFKAWQCWGLMPVMLGGVALYSSINPTHQAEAVPTVGTPRKSLTPQEMIEQRLKQGPAPKAGIPKAAPEVTLTTLYRFKGSDGGRPSTPLSYIDNAFYGATQGAGGNGKVPSTIFKFTPAGHVLTTLHVFDQSKDGSRPNGLTPDRFGSLYGTTNYDGPSGGGTFFKITPSGTFTKLYNFSRYTNNYGYSPIGNLVRDKAGYFYGATKSDDVSSYGSVFKISSSGKIKFLHNFGPFLEGLEPTGGVIRDPEGNLFGTTFRGGAYDKGVVFKISPHGAYTTIHSFRGSDGERPYGGVIQDNEGNLFGTTYSGGLSDNGTVYKISPDGTFRTLYHFTNGSDGAYPVNSLSRDSAGNVYGTAENSIFQIAADGTFTSLYNFNVTNLKDGSSPNEVRSFKGSLYGTTQVGGSILSLPCKKFNGCGTIFKLSISPSAPVRRHSPQPMLQSPPGDPNG